VPNGYRSANLAIRSNCCGVQDHNFCPCEIDSFRLSARLM